MIGFVHDAIVEHILAPQADVTDVYAQPGTNPAVEIPLKAYVDRASAPIDVEPQELDVVDGTSRIVGFEIGGAVEFSHTVQVGLDVQHGDRAVARSLRDLIVVALMLRWRDTRGEIESLEDPQTGQTIESIMPAIDYRPFGVSDTNESATITFTVTTRLGG